MLDKKLPVVVVHGVGSGTNKDRAGFSVELSNIVHTSSRPTKRVGLLGKGKKVANNKISNGILWEEALWESQNSRADEISQFFIKKFPWPGLTKKIAGLVDVLNDVPLYETITGCGIRAAVRKVIAAHPKCVVIAHSLGTVITTDILRIEQQKDNFKSLPISGLITLGSPLNFLRRNRPIKKAFPFKWRNFFYPQDKIVFGGPLKTNLFPGVGNLKLNDKEGLLISHTSYWNSVAIGNAIYRMTVRGK